MMKKYTQERLVMTEDWDPQTVTEHVHRYVMAQQLVKNTVVLDAACGTGYGSGILAEHAKKVYGIDISREAVSYAQTHYARENIDFLQMSIEHLDFPDAFFDVVVSFETIEHVDREVQKHFLSEIKRCLKPDGLLLMTTPNDELYRQMTRGSYDNPYHVAEFDESGFRAFLNKEFQYVTMYYQNVTGVSSILREGKDVRTYTGTCEDTYHSLGRYYLGICSQQPLHDIPFNDIYIPQIKKYYEQIYLKRKAFLVPDYGEGWDGSQALEGTSLQKGYTSFSFKFDLKEFDLKKLKALRFDPCETSCIITLTSITVEGGSCTLMPINQEQSVCGKDIFYTPDPMYLIQTDDFASLGGIVLEGTVDTFSVQEAWNHQAQQLEAARSEKQSLMAALGQVQFSQETIKRTIDENAEQIRRLSSDNEQLRAEVKSLTIEKSDLAAQSKNLMDEVNQRTKEKTELEDRNEKLREEVARLQDECAEFSGKDAKNREELERFREGCIKLIDQNAELTERVERLFGECDMLRKRGADLTEQSRRLHDEAQARGKQIVGLNGRIRNLEEERSNQEALIQTLLTSTSWRMTKPLRDGVYLLKRMMGKTNSNVDSTREPHQQLEDETQCGMERKTEPEGTTEVMPEPQPESDNRADDDTRQRILLVSYYTPSRAHAGGLRVLDLYKYIQEYHGNAKLILFTHKRIEIDWRYDELDGIFDEMYFAPTDNLDYQEYVRVSGDQRRFDVVDFQFVMNPQLMASYRPQCDWMLYTPMELLTKSLFDELRNQIKNSMDQWVHRYNMAIAELQCCKEADAVICVSQSDRAFLTQMLSEDRTFTLETGLSEIEFPVLADPDYKRPEESLRGHQLLYVAYFGSETNVKALRWYLEKVHPLVKKRIPDYRIQIVGRGDLSSFDSLHDANTDFVGEVDSLCDYICRAKIGIAPALFGAGFRGKINQYAIYQVPSVVSPLSANGLAYKDGEEICIAESPEAFADACVKLLEDDELNKRMGQQANRVCREHYTWKSKDDQIKSIYRLEGNEER